MSLSHPSPHHSSRRGVVPRLIVLHSSVGKSDAGDLEWLQSPESKVSYHTLVGRNGGVYTLVDYERKAWHAGVSSWKGVPNCNAYSIGLAWSNRHDGQEALTPIQIAVMKALVQNIRQRWPGIEVVTHADVAPGRKSDPLHSPGFVLADYQSYP